MQSITVESDAFRRFGLTLNGRVGTREWHTPCPFCHDGRDRFIIWEEGNYYCRVCGKKGWLNEDQKLWKPESDWRVKLEERTQTMERERCERLHRWQARFNSGLIWRWHKEMTPETRAQWATWGISNDAVNTYALGYRMHKRVQTPRGELTLPAYTIPITDPRTGDVVNVQYRLMIPSGSTIGKYRQESNIPAAAFYATTELEGPVLVVEGAKKAIVVSERIGRCMAVVGLPSNVPHPDLLKQLDCFEEVYLAFDPWSDQQLKRAAKIVGARARLIHLPGKPDDLFLESGWTPDTFMSYLTYARKEH